MDGGGAGDKSDLERDREAEETEDDAMDDLLRDRFRLTAIAIAEAESKKNGMDVAGPVAACMADLAFKYAENLAKDLELFAHHAGRKTVNMDDVILSAQAHQNRICNLQTELTGMRT
ncbi:PREDICTED: centromere protein S isoform X2 [Tarenaya hassleriana]|uniref:centromere protein S isoform X2 n=1 Tax=Tarenaya hassleriana TaxID=28532 RepID=UPI0008FD7A7F|nr:PREDICTED: centromere protein S isoform X2 [Tarenaya hassleriana]